MKLSNPSQRLPLFFNKNGSDSKRLSVRNGSLKANETIYVFYMDVSNSPADNRSHTPHLPDLSNIPARHNIVTSPHSYGHNERLVFLFSFAELTNCIYKIFSPILIWLFLSVYGLLKF